MAKSNKHGLKVNSSQLRPGDKLLVRAMKSTKGGKLSFYSDETLIGESDTLERFGEKSKIKLSGDGQTPGQIFEYDRARFNLYSPGVLPDNFSGTLTIKSEGDINAVQVVVGVAQDAWQNLLDRQDRFSANGRVWWSHSDQRDQIALGKNPAEIGYRRISPTLYKVNIKGLQHPSTLVFSETYDPLWRIKSASGVRSSFPVYSLVNGFVVDTDGEYEVYFEPQKYIKPGLVVSGASLVVVLLLLVYTKYKHG